MTCFRQGGCSGELEVMDDPPSAKPFPARELLLLIQLRLYRKLMQILNDPTHPMRHYFDSRCSNRSGRFLLLRTYTNHYKALFLPSALSVFNDNYTSH